MIEETSNTQKKLWDRAPIGRPRTFKTPEDMWLACKEYFEWVEANPLREEKVFCSNSEIIKTSIEKPRAMTLAAMYVFIGITEMGWKPYRTREEYKETVEVIESIIRTQKFEGACADLFNANIIARDLCLKEQTSNQSTGSLDINVNFVKERER